MDVQQLPTFPADVIDPGTWLVWTNTPGTPGRNNDPERRAAIACRKVTPHWPQWWGPMYLLVAPEAEVPLSADSSAPLVFEAGLKAIPLERIPLLERQRLPHVMSETQTIQGLADKGIDPRYSVLIATDDPRWPPATDPSRPHETRPPIQPHWEVPDGLVTVAPEPGIVVRPDPAAEGEEEDTAFSAEEVRSLAPDVVAAARDITARDVAFLARKRRTTRHPDNAEALDRVLALVRAAHTFAGVDA